MSTLPYLPNDLSALTFSRSKSFMDYTLDELEHLAGKVSLPCKLLTDTAQETVALFMERWADEKSHLPMARTVLDTIDNNLRKLPIVTGRRM